MNEIITKPANIQRLEFWAATTIYVFAVFFLITRAVDAVSVRHEAALNYYLVSSLCQATILYGAFLLLNFTIVPRLLRREAPVLNALSVLLLFVLMGILFGMVNTLLKYNMVSGSRGGTAPEVVFANSFLYTAWLLLLFGIYTTVKYAGSRLWVRSETLPAKSRLIIRSAMGAFVLWMISMFWLGVAQRDKEPLIIWGVVGSVGILFYCYSFYSLIPVSLSKKRPFLAYVFRAALVLAPSILPVFVLVMLFTHDDDAAIGVASFNAMIQFVLTLPLSWVLFKRFQKGNEEVFVLKKELGLTHASFDFLRSQINPHFLFNALNTIYGTALQEGAERTGEGVQRLGDMMRFMLQENMQDKISLAREIEYLNNYISLQRLRTDASPMVKIEAAIEQPLIPVQIAPMLLIPFVENAFKHGISFREPSHIKIALEVRDHTLNFDVYNSKHVKAESDPEKEKSGIGLSNVKQRLALLYPGKQELIIRETGKEFFVHLTIQLS